MASGEIAFSTSGEDAITLTIEIVDESVPHLSKQEFEEFYEIERTAREILRGNFKQIALQFPDELLRDSVPIFRLLKPRIGEGRELYVLADTSYGSCCVDEVAAQHVDADMMVHYGHACMSQTYRLPVIYVFGKRIIDVGHCVSSFVDILNNISEDQDASPGQRTVVLRHDVAYTYQAENIIDRLRSALKSSKISVSYSSVPTSWDPSTHTPHTSPTSSTIDESDTILYIGSESLGLTNLLMTNSTRSVYSYNPQTKRTRLESASNKLLMRRYALVQKARDADVFGIVVGTLGVASYLPTITHLRTILAHARKKSYTISVGKINPSKLANFMEIECFVLVACPENSLIDAKDFFRPIVTPFELEVALKPEQSWTGKYVLDFERLLSKHADEENAGDESLVDPDEPMFSLVTGKYRHPKRYGESFPPVEDLEIQSSSAIILRNQDDALSKLPDSAAGQFLQGRSYRGLETMLEKNAPSVLEQGRSGIARGYQNDRPG